MVFASSDRLGYMQDLGRPDAVLGQHHHLTASSQYYLRLSCPSVSKCAEIWICLALTRMEDGVSSFGDGRKEQRRLKMYLAPKCSIYEYHGRLCLCHITRASPRSLVLSKLCCIHRRRISGRRMSHSLVCRRETERWAQLVPFGFL